MHTVGDVLRDVDPRPLSAAPGWLEDYLSEHQPVWSKEVKDAARREDFSVSAIDRAARKIGVEFKEEGYPRRTYWSLPQSRQHPHQGPKGGVTDATDATDATDDDLRKRDDATGADSTVTSVTSATSSPREADATSDKCPDCGRPLGPLGKCGPCIAKRVAAQRNQRTTDQETHRT